MLVTASGKARPSHAHTRQTKHIRSLLVSYDPAGPRIKPFARGHGHGRNPSRTRPPLTRSDAALWLAWVAASLFLSRPGRGLVQTGRG